MTSIQEYFSHRVVLLTGATGLVGRVLVEKLLRELQDIRRLYVLIRPRATRQGKTLSAQERLWEDFFSSSAFDALREHLGEEFDSLIGEKVVAVSGDLSQERLGLAPDTYQQLQREVQIIINCGAVVTFDAPLDAALSINTLGPLRALEFAQGCTNSVVMAHVSTCYVNGTRQGLVPEEPLNPQQTVAQADGASGSPYDVDEEVAAVGRLVERVQKSSQGLWRKPLFAWAARHQQNSRGRLLPEDKTSAVERLQREWMERRMVKEGMRWARRRGWNDTYTFTKAMGEQMVMRHRGEVPTLILRPSIIESALKTPAPGWLEGMRMIDPLIVAYGRNQLPNFPGDPKAVLDVIPVDMVVNALLAAIPRIQDQGAPMVYQVATGTENPITIEFFSDLVQDYFRRNSLMGREQPASSLPPVTFLSPGDFQRRLRFRYMLPLRTLAGLAAVVTVTPWGRRLREWCRFRLVGVKRLQYYGRIFSPYGVIRCQYLSRHVGELYQTLLPEEQQRFDFDVSSIDWRYYVQEVHIPGIKRFLLGRSPRPLATQQPLDEPLREREETAEDATELEETSAGARTAVGVAPQLSNSAAPFIDGNGAGEAPGASGSSADGVSKVRSTRRLIAPAAFPPEREVRRWLGETPWVVASRALTRWLFGLGFRFYLSLTCEGRENLPKSGAFIVASNHNSHVDTSALLVLLSNAGRTIHPVAAKDYFFSSPWRAWASRSFLGAVPFDRQSSPVESLGLAVELLRHNHPLIFFPEGSRSPNGKMRSFKPGIGLLALEAGVPVLPVHVQGGFQALPKGSLLLKRHPIRVRIGPPIPVEPYRNSARAESPQEQARRISEEVQRAVEALA